MVLLSAILSAVIIVTLDAAELLAPSDIGRVKRQSFTPGGFFEKYGYLEEKTQSGGQHSDADITVATKAFQKMVGLPVTGVLDRKTVKKMKAPRCGVKDVFRKKKNQPSNIEIRPLEFRTLGLKWKKSEVTWKIVGYTRTNRLAQSQHRPVQKTRCLPEPFFHFCLKQLVQSDRSDRTDLFEVLAKRAFINAFKKWSDVTSLNFREVRGDADILIDFKRLNHGDGSSFDGKGGTLAHAFFPGTSAISGDTHFDDDEKWTMDTPEGTNLEIVAAHEFGHAIGLSHSSNPEALMAPYYQGYDKNYGLHRDDIQGAQSLYGGPARTTRRPTRRPYPTRPPPTRRPPTTRRPVRPVTKPPTPKDICNLKFDTIFNAHDGYFYATRKEKIYKFNRNGVGIVKGFPKRTRKIYPRAPKNAGAAVKDRYNRVYMFKGNKIFRYTGFRLDRGFPKRIPKKNNFFRKIQAAFQWYDGRIYVFKGDKYSIWHESYVTPPSRYPQTISSFWKDLPNNIEAAIRWNRSTYFFKGKKYFRFDDRYRRVFSGYPKTKREPWLGCGGYKPK